MSSSPPETLEVEVFRAGDYGAKGRYGEAELEAIAADYDPARHEAPVTLDHRQEGPADGWVSGLRRAGDRLLATLARLSPRLRDLLAAGAYKKRSVELYRAFRATGRPYIKAVSFLGAAAPEVKGLADPVFGDGDEACVLFEENQGESIAAVPDGTLAVATRARLMASGHWRPEWERLGLLGVFTTLGAGEALESLVAVLANGARPVAFGETLDEGVEDGLSQFVGTPSPDSVQRHRAALAWMAAHPGTPYAEALERAARGD